jgi:simple sugar transport system permease protein
MFAAMGGLISERAGLANIALEGKLLVSAFAAAAVAASTGSAEWGLMAGVVAGAMAGWIFGASTIWLKADHIVMGTAFNLLVVGVIPTLGKAWFGSSGSTPALGTEARLQAGVGFFIAGVALVLILNEALRRTRWGLRVHAAGESPNALLVQGVSPRSVRIGAACVAGALAGLGGVILSLVQGSGYVRDMAGGRGYLALAAIIFGAWKPYPTLAACLIFAAADSAQMLLQGKSIFDISIPASLIQTLPFIATLMILALRRKRVSAPRAINQPL